MSLTSSICANQRTGAELSPTVRRTVSHPVQTEPAWTGKGKQTSSHHPRTESRPWMWPPGKVRQDQDVRARFTLNCCQDRKLIEFALRFFLFFSIFVQLDKASENDTFQKIRSKNRDTHPTASLNPNRFWHVKGACVSVYCIYEDIINKDREFKTRWWGVGEPNGSFPSCCFQDDVSFQVTTPAITFIRVSGPDCRFGPGWCDQQLGGLSGWIVAIWTGGLHIFLLNKGT